MRIITEYDVMKYIGDKFKIQDVKVTKSLRNDYLLSEEQIFEILNKISDMHNLKVDEYKNADTILEIIDFINKRKGLDDYSIRSLFEEICKKNYKCDAIIFDGAKITYECLHNCVINMVKNLHAYGVKKGTKVALILSNRLDYINLYFSLFYIGALPVPVNTRWSKHEVFNVLNDSNANYIVTEEKIGNIRYGEIVSEYAEQEHIYNVFYLGKNVYAEKGICLEQLYDTSDDDLWVDKLEPDAPAMLSYTSGTTGSPKGVILKHNDIVKISKYTTTTWQMNGEDDYPFSIAPLYSAQGFLSLFINFAIERSFKMISSFAPNDILKEISKCENTAIHTQPTMWTLLLNCRAIEFTRFDGLDKLVVSGSLCSPELAKKIEDKLGCTLLNAYGLIEATSVVTMTRLTDPEDVRYNTVGRPIPGVEIKLVDSKRKVVEPGEIGELAIRGYIMLGYYNNPIKTQEMIDEEGWLYTGDLAQYYDDENIRIVGRCKDMVIRGGFNVYPSDIEEYIFQIPDIQSVAVVGKPHAVLGEEIIAFVVPKAGAKVAKKDITSYLFARLANYKMPDKVYFISEMPIILAGKINKKILQGWAIDGVPDNKKILFE